MKKFLSVILSIAMIASMAVVSMAATTVTDESSLTTAVAAGGEVVLGANIEITTTIELNNTVVVDLAGYKLTGPDGGSANWYAFVVESNGHLTLKDSSGGNGELWAKCYGIETKGGTFIMESGKITATNNSSLGAAIVNYGGTVIVNGGEMKASNWAVNTQAYFEDATTEINGGTLETTSNDEAAVQVGGEYNDKSTVVNFNGGEIIGTVPIIIDDSEGETNVAVTDSNIEALAESLGLVSVEVAVAPKSADLVITKDGIEIYNGAANIDTLLLSAGEYSYEVTKDGFDEAEGTLTVSATAAAKISADLLPNGNSGGYGIYLEGPFMYKSDEDVMLNEREVREAKEAFEYGEPVYFLIFDETEGTPLSDRDFVEKLKAKSVWNMGGSAVEAVNVVKKHIAAGDNACYNMLADYDGEGYYYFLEIVTAEKKGTAETDVAGVVEFNRKADSKKGIKKIDDCKVDVEFTLFYPNTWLNDKTITEDRANIEWDTPYVFKFDNDDEAELSFGSANGGNNEGTFTVDVSGQGKIYLEYTTEADDAIAAANEGAKLEFVTFSGANGVGVKFNRTGEFRYEMDDAAYAYRVVDGKLAEIAGLEVEDDEFIFNTNRLEAYVFSDTELVDPA